MAAEPINILSQKQDLLGIATLARKIVPSVKRFCRSLLFRIKPHVGRAQVAFFLRAFDIGLDLLGQKVPAQFKTLSTPRREMEHKHLVDVGGQGTVSAELRKLSLF